MLSYKILFVEDIYDSRQEFLASVERFNHENDLSIEVIDCATAEEAIDLLDGTFDGAVVDLKLGDEGGEGNRVLRALGEKNLRIPIVVLTGTPEDAESGFSHIEVQKKGEADHLEILKDFHELHGSGLTKVMGGRGQFENLLNRVYKENIMPQKTVWKQYGVASSEQTERALMRHIMNHLIQLVDLDEQNCMPEEFYIHPPVDTGLRTGCVVHNKESDEHYVVMNPLCDLTIRRDGKFKAENIVLAKVESFGTLFSRLPEEKQTDGRRTQMLKALRSNTNGPTYHALPGTSFIAEGFLNFEQVMSIALGNIEEQFGSPVSQISPAFAKDIVARFASYLGRQGQPVVQYSE